ncbi:hypothetical protein SNOG_07455 [Parastagonospora nodorum SN15]|uniref:Uncharacterized protein n=1 Tax=Phaeosphaeria nodorum (strain SN15 / ATCC MYA-4574 / FGSC 10173) TaxID=321614 RepID=Q0ULA9_PHANO|nr:hypothetical protein SNOG_07455 [Parastagonospora nodorum SN15]EAT84921.1 hypothetical protein SNOG_07455 [Parastagonospora nodorum SN15]
MAISVADEILGIAGHLPRNNEKNNNEKQTSSGVNAMTATKVFEWVSHISDAVQNR